MNLPDIVAELVRTQNSFAAAAYANCFSETAIVFDEGKTHHGKAEIKEWIADANEKYKTVMKPLEYKEADKESILIAEVSGTFDGSPVALSYHFEFKDGLIQSLKITV